MIRQNCPFCGSADISDGEALTEKPDGTRVTQSQCQGCGAFGPEAITDGPDYGDVRAIEAWNRRARSHAAWQDGEQCRAASGDDVVTDEMVADACQAYRALAKNRLPNWHRKGMRLALIAALAHVARDALRIDWLEEKARIGFELDNGSDDPVASVVFATPANSLRDLRATIDAAMESGNE